MCDGSCARGRGKRKNLPLEAVAYEFLLGYRHGTRSLMPRSKGGRRLLESREEKEKCALRDRGLLHVLEKLWAGWLCVQR